MKNCLYLLTALACAAPGCATAAALITLIDGAGIASTVGRAYTVPDGHTATIDAHLLRGDTAELRIQAPDISAPLPTESIQGALRLGPGWTVQVYAAATESGSLALAQINATAQASAPDYLPPSAVVIPTDADGPVQILLESSTDLITWTAASPGSYGTSSAQRFFRVRAVATP